jgi:hypothetical protein
MNDLRMTQLVPVERVERLIRLVRGEKVLLDADLAVLYGVVTGALNRAVRRNTSRFPTDFMFQLTADEANILKCQIGISSSGHGGRRRSLPYAFTEEGVAMLSSVRRGRCAMARRLRSVSQTSTLNPQLLGGSDWAQLRLTHSQPSTSQRPARNPAPGNRLPLQRSPPALPREEEVTMPNEFQYDVFLSHSAKDNAVVRPLAERLRRHRRRASSQLSTINHQPRCTPLNRERRFIPRRSASLHGGAVDGD